MSRLARVGAWWSGVLDRRGVLLVFVMVCTVAIGGLVELRGTNNTASEAVAAANRANATNQALIRASDGQAERLGRRIDGLLAEIEALRNEVDASHDDIAVLIAQLEALGATPSRGSRTPAEMPPASPPPSPAPSTTRPCTVTVLGICPTG